MVPFAQLEPVQVSGVTVKLATLHNEEDLRRKDVRDGDEVIVMRAGDVIPQVVSPTAKAQKAQEARQPPEPPAKCPSCGTPTVKPEDGVWTICPNRASCPGQLFQAVKHFVGAMDIDGLGEENVRRFLERGLIGSVADIYELDEDGSTALEGFGEISARNLVAAIEASREQPFFRVLYGLGIPGIGYVNARALAQHFRDMDALLEADAEQIEEVPGIGPILARTIAQTLAEERTRELIERLRGHGLQMEEEGPPPGAAEGPLAGKTLVLTGTLPEPQPRGGHGADRGRRRQGHGLGVEEDRLRGGRRGPGHQVHQGAGARHRDAGRGRPAGAAREELQDGRRPGSRVPAGPLGAGGPRARAVSPRRRPARRRTSPATRRCWRWGRGSRGSPARPTMARSTPATSSWPTSSAGPSTRSRRATSRSTGGP